MGGSLVLEVALCFEGKLLGGGGGGYSEGPGMLKNVIDYQCS